MGALRKLVRRSLTSVFPAPTVFGRKTICACVGVCACVAMVVSGMDLY